MSLSVLLFTIGLILILSAPISFVLWFNIRRTGLLLAAGADLVIGLLLVGGTTASIASRVRPSPPPLTQTLEDGITYRREIRDDPRPLVIHIVSIDLTTAQVDFLVTPPELTGEYHVYAETTCDFIVEHGAFLAINADTFQPFTARGPYFSYPQTGDPVRMTGINASEGTRYAGLDDKGMLNITRDNQVTFSAHPQQGDLYNAVSGPLIVEDGEPRTDRQDELDPRTAAGIAGETLLLVVIDGRQPGYSAGMTLPELAALFVELGAEYAINLDGGGSTTLAVADESSERGCRTLNTPVDAGLIGSMRPVGNHLGVILEE
ncbi:MAG: phosphodiester glycosidase family protein [Chloroflexi bacterium]|nr:phosphodiester glycosidase family protein [Chloroflexota bacterium]